MRWKPEFQNWLDTHANVFRRSDALAHGITVRRFRTGTQRGDWVRFNGVWIVANAPQGRPAVSWAALLKGGPNARLTGVAALSLYGLDVVEFRPHLVVPEHNHVAISGCTVFRDKCRVGLDAWVRGFPCTTRQRVAVDALRLLDDGDGRAVLFEVLRRRWITTDELDDWVDLFRGQRGNQQLRSHLRIAQSGTRAESERILLRQLREARISGYTFNAPIHTSTGQLIGVGDYVFIGARVVIEVDGMAWHSSQERFQRDRTRQNELVSNGWHVLRFTWSDLIDRPRQVVDTIRAAVSDRRQQSG